MIDDEKWFENSAKMAGVDMLDAMEKRLAEEFKYLVGKTETDSEAYPASAWHQKT